MTVELNCEGCKAPGCDECACRDCGNVECPGGDRCGMSQCIECNEWRSDPSEFYDGLRCTICCEKEEPCDCGCPAEKYDGHVCEDYE